MPAARQETKCYCGRPLGHTGRHIGFKVPTVDGVKQSKLVPALEAELAECHRDISRLKREIRDRQSALLDAEAKLRPLVALLEVYQNKRIAGPAPETKLTVVAQPLSLPVAIVSKPVLDPVLDKTVLTEADSDPIGVSFNDVQRWAAVRNLVFKSWDDLPKINKRREEFELAPFKRKFGLS